MRDCSSGDLIVLEYPMMAFLINSMIVRNSLESTYTFSFVYCSAAQRRRLSYTSQLMKSFNLPYTPSVARSQKLTTLAC